MDHKEGDLPQATGNFLQKGKVLASTKHFYTIHNCPHLSLWSVMNTLGWGLALWRLAPLGRASGNPNLLSFCLKHMDDPHQCVQELDRIGVTDPTFREASLA